MHDALIISPHIDVSLIYNNWEYCFIEWIIRCGEISIDKSDWKRYSIFFYLWMGLILLIIHCVYQFIRIIPAPVTKPIEFGTTT